MSTDVGPVTATAGLPVRILAALTRASRPARASTSTAAGRACSPSGLITSSSRCSSAPASTAASASNSNAVEAAPGSRWPAVRSPAALARPFRATRVSVESRPARAAAWAARVAAARSDPAAIAASYASIAGSMASNIVLSPSSALPRATTPSSPARSAVPSAAPSSSLASPALMPKRRKNVPYSGPLAPPTGLTKVIPTPLNSSAMSPAGAAARWSITAVMPLARFEPWSPSPIAASSSDSCAACSVTSASKLDNQAMHCLSDTLLSVIASPIAGRRGYDYRLASTSRMSEAASLGVLPTLTPAASSASFLACAVPAEPETIAPA